MAQLAEHGALEPDLAQCARCLGFHRMSRCPHDAPPSVGLGANRKGKGSVAFVCWQNLVWMLFLSACVDAGLRPLYLLSHCHNGCFRTYPCVKSCRL